MFKPRYLRFAIFSVGVGDRDFYNFQVELRRAKDKIKIAKRVRNTTTHAENVADSMEDAAYAFRKTATPLAFLRLVSNIVEHTSRGRKKKG